MKNIYTVNSNEQALTLTLYANKIVRVTYGKSPADLPDSMIVTGAPQAEAPYKAEETKGKLTLCTDFMRITIDKRTLQINCERSDGTSLTRVSAPSLEEYDITRTVGGNIETRQTVDGVRSSLKDSAQEFVRKSNHGRLTFAFSEDESLFGLGSHEEGYASLKGQFVPLYQENMRIALPYFVSSKGHACLFDCTSMMTFDGADGR